MKKDVVIIGSGPAGISAGIYAVRAGFDTLIIERTGMGGGQVLNTYEVDNYPGLPGINGFDLGMKMQQHIDGLGLKVMACDVEKVENLTEVKKLYTSQGEIETKALVIATGATHTKLNVKGENELAGMGVSYCATCDGAFFQKRTVAVVGGGDVAVEDAIFLSGICEKVYLIHRRDDNGSICSFWATWALSTGNTCGFSGSAAADGSAAAVLRASRRLAALSD